MKHERCRDVQHRLPNYLPRDNREPGKLLTVRARAAEIHDTVTRAISGHATVEMQQHYSTARAGEVRDALRRMTSIATGAKVIDLGKARRERAA